MVISNKKKLKKTHVPFLWIRFYCLKAAERLRGGSLILTKKFPGVPGTRKLASENAGTMHFHYSYTSILYISIIPIPRDTLVKE